MTLSYAEKQRIRGMLADKHRAGVGHCHTEVSRSMLIHGPVSTSVPAATQTMWEASSLDVCCLLSL